MFAAVLAAALLHAVWNALAGEFSQVYPLARALPIGALVFRERIRPVRVLATVVAVAGIALLHGP